MAGDGKGGTWARSGAIVSAGLASMCCILPLGFGALGISTTVVASFFEPFRPWFLTLAGLLLALGFYFAFRPAPEGEVCATQTRRLSRLSKPALWISTAAVIGLATFPSVSGIAAGGGGDLTATTGSKVVAFEIAGMTCESCTPSVRAALLDVPGVIDAAVSYDRKSADVKVRIERAPETSALLAAITQAGYTARVVSP